MKIIYNNIIPFKGFAAMNFLGLILFVRKGRDVGLRTKLHENIHSAQYKEMLWVGFLLWYVAEWLVRLIIEVISGNWSDPAKTAYRNISLEREAYANDWYVGYKEHFRKPYAWLKYLKE